MEGFNCKLCKSELGPEEIYFFRELCSNCYDPALLEEFEIDIDELEELDGFQVYEIS